MLGERTKAQVAIAQAKASYLRQTGNLSGYLNQGEGINSLT